MSSNCKVGTIDTISAQSDNDKDFDSSLFQLPIRHRQTQVSDLSANGKTAVLLDSNPGYADSLQSWQVLHLSNRSTSSDTRSISSQHDDQRRLADKAFEKLASGDVELLETCLDAGADIEHENPHGLTLLVMAIKASNTTMAGLLLRKGADVQHRVQGKPPLLHAVQNQEHGPILIRLLLDHGANLNTICGPQRMNALHWAAAAGMADSADYLLSRGIDIEATCAGGHTALHVAAGTGHLVVVKLLLAQGAELERRGELGGNAMTFAASMGHVDIVKLFVEEGLAVDNRDDKGLTALLSACELGHTSVVEFLLEKGADVNNVDSKQSTPALAAATRGHIDILQALINRGALLGLANATGETALELAMSKGHTDVVRLILTALGGPGYPLESVSLEIASARRLETMRSVLKSASLMHVYFGPKDEPHTTHTLIKWILDTGGELVRTRAISNMILVAMADANSNLVQALLSAGADPNEFSLSTAVVNRNIEIVRLLIDEGAGSVPSTRCITRADGCPNNVLLDVLLNMPYQREDCLAILQVLLNSGRFHAFDGPSSNQTAFWRVLESEEWDLELRSQVAFMMLESVTNVNYACNGDGGTLMHHVVRHGCEDMVSYLLSRRANINVQDIEGRTPFILACEYQPQMIEFLLQQGADPNLPYDGGRGPIHAAATVGNVPALVSLWAQRHIRETFDQSSRDGWTPLGCALAADQQDAALFLVERGADVKHTVAVTGRTMLHLAAAFGHEKVFEHIMNLGDIGVNMKDRTKASTPLILACAGTRYRLGSIKIVHALLAAGADIEAAGSHSDRPLHVAITTGNTAIAHLLIEHGADIHAVGYKGRTPLHMTAQNESPDIMRLLLQRGAVAEAIDDSGRTPLHLCTRLVEAQILIDHGADINSIDKDGLTLMHHSVQDGDPTLFAALFGYGASPRIRTKIDGRDAMDMVEDLIEVRLRHKFLAAVH